MNLARRVVAEATGTALLLIAVTGSGIMAERLAAGNVALALLANSLATGGALIALILTFAPISGAHFNPVVTLSLAWSNKTRMTDVACYVMAQVAGALLGVLITHFIFALPLLELSSKDRSGSHLVASELIATFGLLAVILSGVKSRSEAIPYAVAAYITGAYWFTSSTSFANPAVTLARAFTNTFVGIQLADVPWFVVVQCVGMLTATLLFGWLYSVPSKQ